MQEHSYLWHSRRLPRYVGLVTPGVVLPRPATHTNVTRGLEGGPQAERDAWMKIKAGVSGNAMKTLSYRNSIDRAHVIRTDTVCIDVTTNFYAIEIVHYIYSRFQVPFRSTKHACNGHFKEEHVLIY